MERLSGCAHLPTCGKEMPIFDFRRISSKRFGRGGVDIDVVAFFYLLCNFFFFYDVCFFSMKYSHFPVRIRVEF